MSRSSMKSTLRLTLVFGCLVYGPGLIADTAALKISDDALHANYSVHDSYSELSYGAGYFYKDADEAIHIGNLDLHSRGQTAIGNLPTTVEIGIQGNLAHQDDLNASAAALGGSMRVNLPDAPGLSLQANAHFAPDVLAFEDAKRFVRAGAQLNYRIIQSADLSAGYRYLSTKLKSGEKHTFESGLFLGVELNF